MMRSVTDVGPALRLLRRLALGLFAALAVILLGTGSAHADESERVAKEADPRSSVSEHAHAAPTETVHKVQPVVATAQNTVAKVGSEADDAARHADQEAQQAPVVRDAAPDRALSQTVESITEPVVKVAPKADETVDQAVDVVEHSGPPADSAPTGAVPAGRERSAVADARSDRVVRPDSTRGPDDELRDLVAAALKSQPAWHVDATVGGAALETNIERATTPDGENQMWAFFVPSASGVASAASGTAGGTAGQLPESLVPAADFSAKIIRKDAWRLSDSPVFDPASPPG